MQNTHLIGVDIDDVCYRTSEMILELGSAFLEEHNYMHTINKEEYNVAKIFDVGDGLVGRMFEHVFDFYDKNRLCKEALEALTRVKAANPNLEFAFVTARKDHDGEEHSRIRSLFEDTVLADVDIYLGVKNKARFCESLGMLAMIDDYAENIMQFKRSWVTPILVATPNIHHNKRFLAQYRGNKLTSWEELDHILQSLIENTETTAIFSS